MDDADAPTSLHPATAAAIADVELAHRAADTAGLALGDAIADISSRSLAEIRKSEEVLAAYVAHLGESAEFVASEAEGVAAATHAVLEQYVVMNQLMAETRQVRARANAADAQLAKVEATLARLEAEHMAESRAAAELVAAVETAATRVATPPPAAPAGTLDGSKPS